VGRSQNPVQGHGRHCGRVQLPGSIVLSGGVGLGSTVNLGQLLVELISLGLGLRMSRVGPWELVGW